MGNLRLDVFIVTYHAICDQPSPVCSTPTDVESDLSALVEAGFSFVSLDDCADWLAGTRVLPPRAAAVTFDDGYASVVSRGMSILQRWHVPATVFAIAGRIGADNRWSGQWRSIPSMRLADASQLRELVATGVTIGSHTSSHPVLTEVDAATLRREVEESADQLEQVVQTPIRHFAYPYGMKGEREVAAIRGRYRTGVNTMAQVVTAGADPYDLCRVDCHDLRVAIRLKWFDASTLGPYLAIRRGARRVRRGLDRLTGRI